MACSLQQNGLNGVDSSLPRERSLVYLRCWCPSSDILTGHRLYVSGVSKQHWMLQWNSFYACSSRVYWCGGEQQHLTKVREMLSKMWMWAIDVHQFAMSSLETYALALGGTMLRRPGLELGGMR